MDGNRHNFVPFLSGVVLLQLALLTAMSVLAYLSEGSGVAQMVTMNMEAGSGLSDTVNVCLMIGVLCSFPLVVYPVVHLTESTLLASGAYVLAAVKMGMRVNEHCYIGEGE